MGKLLKKKKCNFCTRTRKELAQKIWSALFVWRYQRSFSQMTTSLCPGCGVRHTTRIVYSFNREIVSTAKKANRAETQ